jgi:hypothetical protein
MSDQSQISGSQISDFSLARVYGAGARKRYRRIMRHFALLFRSELKRRGRTPLGATYVRCAIPWRRLSGGAR